MNAEAVTSLLTNAGLSGGSSELFGMIADFLNEDTKETSDSELDHYKMLVKRLKRERRLLIKRNLLITRALGACECWGAGCRSCRGNGTPGFYAVDLDLADQLIGPLIEAYPELASSAEESIPEKEDK